MRQLEQIFKGLADTTRLRILNLLLHGELCVCDIQHVLASPQSNVSRHLIYLKNAGLVADRREGARMYYRLAQPAHRPHRSLFVFLRQAFRTEPELARDSRKLKQTIQAGLCTSAEWHPYGALSGLNAGEQGR